MTIDEAVRQIRLCSEAMDTKYGKTVFDEWAVISIGEGKGRLLAYIGPRKTDFQKNFLSDIGPLRAGLVARDNNVGDFEFSRHGVGTGIEAYMMVGDGSFLICNNTVQSMDAISKDPLWLGAQVPFVELSERVREDPLVA